MAPYPLPSLAAAMTGIIGSAWGSGGMASLSIAGIPAAKSLPQNASPIWAVLFARGIRSFPPTVIGAAVGYAYAAWDASSRGSPRSAVRGYAVAAVLSASIVPFTMVAMGSTNSALQADADGVRALGQSAVMELVHKWGVLNVFRSLLPLAGSILGLITLCGDITST